MDPSGGRRPRDFALLSLAAAGGPPRARARDQRGDLAGEELRRAALRHIAAADPEPDDLAAALADFAREAGEAEGPARAVAALLLEQWQAARNSAAYWSWLLGEALAAGLPAAGRRGHADVP